jgi:exodeoxyribonuclease V alpha subunit
VTEELADADLVLGLPPTSLLATFNRAGVLAPADVHVALVLCRLAGERDQLVALAAALAVRAPRAGHVLVDLDNVRATVVAGSGTGTDDEAVLKGLAWPDVGTWLQALTASPLVSAAPAEPAGRPLRLEGSLLYLDRYWRDECAAARELQRRAVTAGLPLDEAGIADLLNQLFPDESSGLQRVAAARSARHLLSVIAGGPGTGKTTTAARLLVLLYGERERRGVAPPLVALAAPTGKAAARVGEAVREEARRLPLEERLRHWLESLDASTVDRLLGRRPGSARFRYNRYNRLPHDVVVVDETSMMSLPLMASLLDAVRSDARLVLLGDPEQLASVEAGAVLADIVGPVRARRPDGLAAGSRQASNGQAGGAPAGGDGGGAPAGPLFAPPTKMDHPLSKCVTVLEVNHRFHGALQRLAAAVRAGDGDTVMAVLEGEGEGGAGEGSMSDVRWLNLEAATSDPATLRPVLALAGAEGTTLAERCTEGDAGAAVEALNRFRLLCAHREGPDGASTWNQRIEEWLLASGRVRQPVNGWYAGRPVVVTENDYSLSLFNGDVGVAVLGDAGRLEVVFQRGAAPVRVSPSRLVAVQTAFAMTAHRAQGSEFEEVAFLMPAAGARILTRELFYTAVTRARRRVTVVGTEDAVRAALERPVGRASGLTGRLWGPNGNA